MNASGAILTIAFSLLVFVLPARPAIIAYLGSMLYITQGQAIDIAGTNFMAIRFVELAAFIRTIVRSEFKTLRLVGPDRTLTAALLLFFIFHTIQQLTFNSYQLGNLVDALLVYFTFRILFNVVGEFEFIIKGFALLLTPFAALMLLEATSGRNPFAYMGGVPEVPIFRDGHFRCQASFRHAITAGTVGATMLAIFLAGIFARIARLWSFVGLAACVTIVLASHSSGPLMATITSLASWACWPFRQHMKWVRRSILALLISLHILMTRPVWFIFDWISGFVGGDGWHRSNLIDQFLKHSTDWVFFGMPIEMTGDWAATKMPWGGVDITNHYVGIGVGGGLLPLALFFCAIASVFSLIGTSTATSSNALKSASNTQLLLWGCGSAFCSHVVNLTAVIYWDQSYVLWYMHIALAVSLAHFSAEAHLNKAS